MKPIQNLKERWNERVRRQPFHSSLNITENGLLLGAGTCLAPMMKDRFGVLTLDLDGREEHILALLSLAFQKPVPIAALKFIKRASMQWAKGEKALAHLELAYAALPNFEATDDAYQLFCADSLIAEGVSPRWLMRSVGLDTYELDLLKGHGYNPNQPRVPAGNGHASGEWGEGGGTQADRTTQVAQNIGSKEPPEGTPIEPFGEQVVSFKNLPPNAQQILKYRFFVQDEKTGLWHVGMLLPLGVEARVATQTRGQDAGIADSGYLVRPPDSPPLPPIGSNLNPSSAVRTGKFSPYTGQPYFRTFNAEGQPISPVTGRVVPRQSGPAHYPMDPYRSMMGG